MSEPRQLGIARDADQLVAILRARAAELGLSLTSADDVAGLCRGYTQKILAGTRFLGRTSVGPVVQTLGVMIAVLEDPDTLQRNTARVERRTKGPELGSVRAIRTQARPAWLFTPSRAKEAAKIRWENVTAKARSRICRRAARARWAKRRASDAAGALHS
jgi:hypothetical protein